MCFCRNSRLSPGKKPIASSLHATPVLHTRHCAGPANTILGAFAVKCQPELLIVSADPAVPAAESEQWLVFEVTDTGCGISQRGLASLFTEYVQVSAVRNLSLVQWSSQSHCAQRNASSLMPTFAFALFCSIACALLLCQQLSTTNWPFSIGISTCHSCNLSCRLPACLPVGSQACAAHMLPCTSSEATPAHLTGSRALLLPGTAP